jgi:hypothetical protein
MIPAAVSFLTCVCSTWIILTSEKSSQSPIEWRVDGLTMCGGVYDGPEEEGRGDLTMEPDVLVERHQPGERRSQESHSVPQYCIISYQCLNLSHWVEIGSPGRMRRSPSTPKHSPAPRLIQTENPSPLSPANLGSAAYTSHQYGDQSSAAGTHLLLPPVRKESNMSEVEPVDPHQLVPRRLRHRDDSHDVPYEPASGEFADVPRRRSHLDSRR